MSKSQIGPTKTMGVQFTNAEYQKYRMEAAQSDGSVSNLLRGKMGLKPIAPQVRRQLKLGRKR